MRINNQPLFQELLAFICHPNWLQKCATRLGLDFEDYQELLDKCRRLVETDGMMFHEYKD